MNRLYRLKLKPTAPWRTPWQADTLTGMLLATAARTLGQDILSHQLIDPMLAGNPPFVLSDALPGDLLPFPIHLRLSNWPEGANLKAVKRARWLSPEHFHAARSGHLPDLKDLMSDEEVFLDHTRQHNTLSRLTDTSSSAGDDDETSSIGLYQKPETLLRAKERENGRGALKHNPALRGADYLSVYIRFLDETIADGLLGLFHELSLTGYGADASTGRGQFDLPDDPQPVPHLDNRPPNANGVLSLSTFQPGQADPTDGYWDAFPKFGKLSPDLGVSNDHIHKNTLVLVRPGACFRVDPLPSFLGRAIPMRELLPVNTFEELKRRNLNIIHPAFGLVLPVTLSGA